MGSPWPQNKLAPNMLRRYTMRRCLAALAGMIVMAGALVAGPFSGMAHAAGEAYGTDWPIDSMGEPGAVATAPAGVPGAGTIYVASNRTDQVRLTAVDSATGNTLWTTTDIYERPISMAVAPAGTPRAGSLYLFGSESLQTVSHEGDSSEHERIDNDFTPSGRGAILPSAADASSGRVVVVGGHGGDGIVRTYTPDLQPDLDQTGIEGAGSLSGVAAVQTGTNSGSVFVSRTSTGQVDRLNSNLQVTGTVVTALPARILTAGVRPGEKAATVFGAGLASGLGVREANVMQIRPNLTVLETPLGTADGFPTGLAVADSGTVNQGTSFLTFPDLFGGVRVFNAGGTVATTLPPAPGETMRGIAVVPAGLPAGGIAFVAVTTNLGGVLRPILPQPGQVRSPQVTIQPGGRATVTYQRPFPTTSVGLTRYQLSTNNGQSYGPWQTVGGAGLTLQLTGLQPGSRNIVRVAGTNTVGTVGLVRDIRVDYPATSPSAPRSIAVKKLKPKKKVSKATVTWATPASTGGAPITSYQVRHRIGKKKFTRWVTVSSAQRRIVIGKLKRKSVVHVEVRARNSVGFSPVAVRKWRQ